MFDDATDEVEAHFREIGILIAGHLGNAVFPDREVAMHARTIVTENRLRHEGGAHTSLKFGIMYFEMTRKRESNGNLQLCISGIDRGNP